MLNAIQKQNLGKFLRLKKVADIFSSNEPGFVSLEQLQNLNKILGEIIDEINTEKLNTLVASGVFKGEPGKNADEERVIKAVLERVTIPKPQDGKSADEEKIIREVLALIPKPKDGKSVNFNQVVEAVLAQIPKAEPVQAVENVGAIFQKFEELQKSIEVISSRELLTIDDVLKELKNPQSKYRLQLRDIKDMPLNFNDMRWHGGGAKINVGGTYIQSNYSNLNLIAGTGITISTAENAANSRVDVTITGTAGGAQVSTEQLTGTQSGTSVTLNLTQLQHTFIAVLFVTRQGQILTPTAFWTRSGNTITIFNADAGEDFLVSYTY